MLCLNKYFIVLVLIFRILHSFPNVENSCEIKPSHMVFMIFNFVQHALKYSRSIQENAFCMVFHVRWISHHSSPNHNHCKRLGVRKISGKTIQTEHSFLTIIFLV